MALIHYFSFFLPAITSTLPPHKIMSSLINQSFGRSLFFSGALVLPCFLVSIGTSPGNVLASPSKLDQECRSYIERSITSAGFVVKPSGFISNRIQSSNSYDRALSEMWSSRPPAEISYADSRGNKRYYTSVELPLPPGPNGQISPSIREKIQFLESALLRKTNCIQTLRINQVHQFIGSLIRSNKPPARLGLL